MIDKSKGFNRGRFFILGAPKCGTTSLARWLGEHPGVYMSPVKEPHFFSSDLKNRTVTSERSYESLFSSADIERQIVGEASTWYLFSRVAVKNILERSPNSRFIVMTRDPVEMAISLHHHNVRVLHEDEKDFVKAWALQGERIKGNRLPRGCVEPNFLQYGAACSLGAQVDRLLEYVAPEQVLHISLEGMKQEPKKQYARVLEFLGCENDGREDFLAANEARGARSRFIQRVLRGGARLKQNLGWKIPTGLSKLNDAPLAKQVVDQSFLNDLTLYFADDSRLLQSTLSRLQERNLN